MQTVEVKVERDHLERLATSKSPVAAIAELVWNALDADAKRVTVALERGRLGALETISVIDDGHGLAYEEATTAFARLGGSGKLGRSRTVGGRILHGRQGKGRFQAFSVGDQVTWSTRYWANGELREYTIQTDRSNIKRFRIEDPQPSKAGAPGTEAKVSHITRSLTVLTTPRARQTLNEEFALYLRQYRGIEVIYDGSQLDPSAVEDHVADYPLPPLTLQGGRLVESSMTVVEWSTSTERALFLCDADGFTLHKVAPGIQAPGFNFTAYLKAAFVRELWDAGDLQLEDLHPDVKALIDAAKAQLRTHFRARVSQKAGGLVEQWKTEDIYPFTGSPRSIVEEAERQVFDVLALNVHEYLPDFGSSSRENRKLSFRLLKTAIETSPDAVQSILQDVLKLPEEKQRELAELIDKTSLEAIISASRIVADRLDFLQGLDVLLYSAVGKEHTLERRHLHKIVAEHCWLFGEEFNLAVSDRSLTNVLKKHLTLLEVDILDDGPVLREDGRDGIVDLMFSRLIPQPRADEREHLIVELKRPLVPIGTTEATQIKSYAYAVAADERFRDTKTRWEFWALANEVEASVRLEANQTGRPAGLLLDVADLRLKVWVKTWGQIIQDCRARLRFFQDRLNYVADECSGLAYLRRVHGRYLPTLLFEDSARGAPD
ncbi:MAG: DNA mismatch repair protein [Thermoanaerobaculia bacterium]|nr:DNA mismatch repair protein [Thermoanaerobaculia bacterium]